MAKSNPVSHPSHYTGFSNGAEVIDITENIPANRAAIVQYVVRAGKKSARTEIQDLLKARWYLNREIERMKKERARGQ